MCRLEVEGPLVVAVEFTREYAKVSRRHTEQSCGTHWTPGDENASSPSNSVRARSSTAAITVSVLETAVVTSTTGGGNRGLS